MGFKIAPQAPPDRTPTTIDQSSTIASWSPELLSWPSSSLLRELRICLPYLFAIEDAFHVEKPRLGVVSSPVSPPERLLVLLGLGMLLRLGVVSSPVGLPERLLPERLLILLGWGMLGAWRRSPLFPWSRPWFGETCKRQQVGGHEHRDPVLCPDPSRYV